MNTLNRLCLTARQLAKSPAFSLTVVLTLALGIGATTAIFSLIEGILLRPLPFQDPEQLVLVGDHLSDSLGIPVGARELAIYASANTAFDSIGGFTGANLELSGGDVPVAINATRMTASTFPTLGVRPLLGRAFTQAEDDSRQPVALLSYALWTSRYHRDPHVLGSAIVLDRKAYTIVGVMPRDFAFPVDASGLDASQLWIPMSLTAEELSEQAMGFWGYRQVARMKPGVTVQQAALDADRVAKLVMKGFPPTMSALRLRGDAEPLRENAVSESRPILRTLFLAVSIVLLIACVNVATLMLVRAIRRRREIAVRLALGARTGAIVRESILEGLLLSSAGGVLGLALAAAAIHAAPSLLPASLPRVDSIRLDTSVAAFALLLALATGILCSLAPAFAALRANLLDSLRDGSRTGTDAASHAWLRSALVVAEIAIALTLLTVSGEFVRSYQRMLAVDPGYRPDHVLVASYQLPLRQYSAQVSVDTFNRNLMDRLSHKPGIASASLSSILPATDRVGQSAYTIEGQPAEGWTLRWAEFGTLSGDYFHTLGIPLLEGRTFTPADRSGAPPVIIVNQSMAHDSWPGQSPLGKRMHVGNPKKALPWATVVGVVADTNLGSRDEPAGDQWYAPIEQPEILSAAPPSGGLMGPDGGFIAIRSALPPEQMIETLRQTVAGIDPQLALDSVQTMQSAIANIEEPRRFNTGLIGGFAMGSLLLAIIGIYAVVAFSVSLRAQEIAIRMALGAERSRIAQLVLKEAAKLAFIGCALGTVGSAALSRVVSSFLFDVSATDPWIYLASIALMIAMALLAAALPALRAASSDPVDALRAM